MRPGASGSLDRLRAYRLRTVLAGVGLAAGVMMLVIASSLIDSFRLQLTEGFVHLGERTIFVEPVRGNILTRRPPRRLTAEDGDALSHTVLTLESVVPLYSLSGQVQACGVSVNVTIEGVSPEYAGLARLPPSRPRFVSWADMRDKSPHVVLTRQALREFGPCTVSRVLLSGRPCEVVGVLEEDAGQLTTPTATAAVYISASTFRRFYGADVSPTRLMAKRRSEATQASTVSAVEAVLKTRHGLRASDVPDVRIYSADDVVKTYRQLGFTLKMVSGALLVSTVAVGLLGLLNSIMMGVRERVPEIGIRRVVGAMRRTIARQFVLEGAVVGALGAAAGALGGLLLAVLVEVSMGIPTVVDWPMALVLVPATAFLSIWTSVAPAVHASRIQIIDAVQRD